MENHSESNQHSVPRPRRRGRIFLAALLGLALAGIIIGFRGNDRDVEVTGHNTGVANKAPQSLARTFNVTDRSVFIDERMLNMTEALRKSVIKGQTQQLDQPDSFHSLRSLQL